VKTVKKTNRSAVVARQNQVIAVVIKQYGTGLYRACVSLDRDDVTFLSVHRDERSATETINLFWRAYDDGRLKTRADVATFIDSLPGSNVPPTDNHPAPPTTPPRPPAPALPSMPPLPPLPPVAAQEVFTPLAA
jgi:hypothetical protein